VKYRNNAHVEIELEEADLPLTSLFSVMEIIAQICSSQFLAINF